MAPITSVKGKTYGKFSRKSNMQAIQRPRKLSRQNALIPYSRGTRGSERKFFDTTKASTTAATAGTISDGSLLLITEGVTDQTRVGNRILLKSVMLRGSVQINSTSDPNGTSDVVRIVVYLDKQCNGAAAGVTDILASANYRAFNNLDNSDRFVVLCDHVIDMNVQSGSYDGAQDNYGECVQHFFLKKKLSLDIKYKGNAGTVVDLASANIGVLTISKAGSSLVDYIARVRYQDA